MSKALVIKSFKLALLLGILLIGFSYVLIPQEFWNKWILFRGLRNIFILFFIIYLNEWQLMPKFYLRKRFLAYFIILGLILFSITLLIYFIPFNKIMNPPPIKIGNLLPGPKANMAINQDTLIGKLLGPSLLLKTFADFAPSFLTAIFISNSMYLTQYANQKEKENTALEKQKLITEIKFLKAQINPHFLFNALNNIYTLSYIQSKQTPEYLLKLSNMLKYMVYDCSAKMVPLYKEIEYIENYIALFSLKEPNRLQVNFSSEIEDGHKEVPPLLFIPFVENAYKHSKIEDLDNGWIKINLRSISNEIVFKVDNSYFASHVSKDKTGGVGLENVRQRLELLYGSNFQLMAEMLDDSYSVTLIIRES